jgi:hypothetical protein
MNGLTFLDQIQERHQILLNVLDVASLFVGHQHFDDQFQACNIIGLQCNAESPSPFEMSLHYWEVIWKQPIVCIG